MRLQDLRTPFLSTRREAFHHPFLLGAFCLFAAIVCLYSVAFGHNFLFDEEGIIIRNPSLKSLALLPKLFENGYFYFNDKSLFAAPNYYRPVTSLTFFVDHSIWKLNPLGYNLTNTFLHFLVSLTFFGLLFKITQDMGSAFLGALLWCVHPLHTEAVTYIASRGDLIGAWMVLSAVLFYSDNRVLPAMLCYLVALFSKENTLLLPVYLAAYQIAFRPLRFGQLWKKILPFLVMAAFYLAFRRYLCPVKLTSQPIIPEEALLRFLSMGGPFLSYLDNLFYPASFKFLEATPLASGFLDPKVFLTLAVIALLLAGWVLTLRRRGGAFFGMTLFLVSLAPHLQIIHFYPEWSEHYFYVPSMGLSILLALLIKRLFENGKRVPLAALMAALAVFFAFFCYRTWHRNEFYNDAEKYYDSLSKSHSPYAHFGHEQLAIMAIQQGNWDDAIVPIRAALKIEPKFFTAHNLIACYYHHKGTDLDKALDHFKKAYEMSGRFPPYLANVGVGYLRLERYADAARIFEEFQRIRPEHSDGYKNLMYVYAMLNEPRKAIRWGHRGLKTVGQKKSTFLYLSMEIIDFHYWSGEDAAAIAKLKRLLKRYPNELWYSDVMRLLLGDMPAEEFQSLLETQYKEERYQAPGKLYILMSHVLNKNNEAVKRFIAGHEDFLEQQIKLNKLLNKEIERARILGSPVSSM